MLIGVLQLTRVLLAPLFYPHHTSVTYEPTASSLISTRSFQATAHPEAWFKPLGCSDRAAQCQVRTSFLSSPILCVTALFSLERFILPSGTPHRGQSLGLGGVCQTLSHIPCCPLLLSWSFSEVLEWLSLCSGFKDVSLFIRDPCCLFNDSLFGNKKIKQPLTRKKVVYDYKGSWIDSSMFLGCWNWWKKA